MVEGFFRISRLTPLLLLTFTVKEWNMLNEALRLIRVYHDLSQTQLSFDLAISNSFLSEIESGKKTPTLELLDKYGKRFDIPVSSLLFFSERLDESKVTDKVRVGIAKKVVFLLQWVVQKEMRPALKNQ